jgi:hypothetical protein
MLNIYDIKLFTLSERKTQFQKTKDQGRGYRRFYIGGFGRKCITLLQNFPVLSALSSRSGSMKIAMQMVTAGA